MYSPIEVDIFIYSMTFSTIINDAAINIPMHVLISNCESISGEDNWIS